MQTFLKNKMNDGFLYIPNLEIELVLSPISSFAYADSTEASLNTDVLNIATVSRVAAAMTLNNA